MRITLTVEDDSNPAFEKVTATAVITTYGVYEALQLTAELEHLAFQVVQHLIETGAVK